MKCPKCNGPLQAWPWQDGGYKGVSCRPCNLDWWSDILANVLHEAEKAAVAAAVESTPFPPDAKVDEPPY